MDVHLNIIRDLSGEGCSSASDLEVSFLEDIGNLICILHVVAMAGSFTDEQKSVVLGYGEIWSVKIVYRMALHTPKVQSRLSESLSSPCLANDGLILSQAIRENRAVRAVPLLLNAREVLTLCQQNGFKDIKRRLPKHHDVHRDNLSSHRAFS